MRFFKLAGIAAAALVAAGVALNWADLKRYMKIEIM
jgi:hypothetical protein